MKNFKKIIHWLLLIISLVLIISGYGITNFWLIEKLTFGLLTKALSFKIHNFLTIPFILIMATHIYFVVRRKK